MPNTCYNKKKGDSAMASLLKNIAEPYNKDKVCNTNEGEKVWGLYQ